MEHFANIIKENKPNRKDTTVNQYARSIIKIQSGIGYETPVTDLSFLDDTDKVDTYIDTLPAISTRRNLYTAILSLSTKANWNDAFRHYKRKEREGNNKQFELYTTDNMSEKKTKKYNAVTKT
jgi:hypothetical protein